MFDGHLPLLGGNGTVGLQGYKLVVAIRKQVLHVLYL